MRTQDGNPGGQLGTFAGVFTPSILTILGIILFLRLGFVVGAAGVPRALLIILFANAISILTSISLSAIATNLRVRGGGDYYLISRTLGVEYGGALGIVLFLAQSVSIAFYAIGFGEAVTAMLPPCPDWWVQAIAATAVSVLLILAWLGSDWATRFQFVVMAILLAAIVAFFLGGIPDWSTAQLQQNFSASNLPPEYGTPERMPFWVVFALFFPAVTGFTQGVSMSGDLKDAGRSLPNGTFAAVLLSMLVYLGVAVVIAAATPGSSLVADNNVMRRIAVVPWLIDAGVIAATLSSALASFLGAPRILQSLSSDRVFPVLNSFAVGHGPSNNPRRGVLLSALIAYGTIGLGNLNVIAPVVSMFFLISYGLLNYATYFEARANSPSFRPRFRFFNARASLLGCLACLGAMVAINPTAGVIAVASLFALHQYVSRSVAVERWADSGRSRRIQRIRDNLLHVSAQTEHSRDWRPVTLAFTENPARRERMLRFASWIEGGAGFTTAVRLLPGGGTLAGRRQQEAERELRKEIARYQIPAFSMAIVTEKVDDALPVLLQSHGLGRVRANTVLLNWYDRAAAEGGDPGLASYGRYLRLALRYGSNVILLAAGDEGFARIADSRPNKRRIDVWYRDNSTGKLMLLLAYLMKRSEEWEDANIHLLVGQSSGQSSGQATEQRLAEVKQMLTEIRIDATPEIVDEVSAVEIARRSSDASLVFLPFRIDDDGPADVFGGSLDELAKVLNVTVMVLASQDIELSANPEEGLHGEIADAVDRLERARKAVAQAEEESARATKLLEESEAKFAEAGDPAAPEQTVEAARQAADKITRRLAKLRAKRDQAELEADELTLKPIRELEKNGES